MQILAQNKPDTILKDSFADCLATPLLTKEITKHKYLSHNNT
jgi:hypothetical protein